MTLWNDAGVDVHRRALVHGQVSGRCRVRLTTGTRMFFRSAEIVRPAQVSCDAYSARFPSLSARTARIARASYIRFELKSLCKRIDCKLHQIFAHQKMRPVALYSQL